MQYFSDDHIFQLENGETLNGITIAFDTYGRLNENKSNVVWVCHALTANSNAADWWKGLIGPHCLIDPEKYFIVCANILGSCFGTTGPLSYDDKLHKPFYSHFPMITIRDMVNAHILLRKFLGIHEISLAMGGSMGGYQILEWCLMEKETIKNIFIACTSARESAWGIAVHTAQRLAIEADGTWKEESVQAGKNGLKAARAIGMLTYRNYGIFVEKQTDHDPEKLDHFKASSYISHQGDKLVSRFNANCYWLLTKSMDSHHLARGRNQSIEEILKSIHQKALVLGISNDLLCPVDEQIFLARHLSDAKLVVIESGYGHDGFLVETAKISEHLSAWLSVGQ